MSGVADRKRLEVTDGLCWLCEREPVKIVQYEDGHGLGFCLVCVKTMLAALKEAGVQQ